MLSVKHAASLYAVLFGLWLFLSGHYTALLLTFGLLSTGFAVFLALRMEVVDHESYPLALTLKLPAYWLWLLREIVVSNLAVAREILRSVPNISPTVITVPTNKRSDIGRANLANSITLTPGTLSLDVKPDAIQVHALTRESARQLLEGQLDQRVPDLGKDA